MFYKFRALRDKFKHAVRAKSKNDKDYSLKFIENSGNDQKCFLGLIKKISGGSLVKKNIPAKSWYDYCSTLLNRKPNNVDFSFHRFVQNYLSTHDRNCAICSGEDSSGYHELLELNKGFTETEVREEIKQAPNGNRHEVDGILNEAIKAAKDKLVPLLVKFLNTILATVCFYQVGVIS